MNTIQRRRPGAGTTVSRIRSWALLPSLIVSMMWLGAAPSQASSGSWEVPIVAQVGCESGDWVLGVDFNGASIAADYVPLTRVTSGGLVYMDSAAPSYAVMAEGWTLHADDSHGPTTGTYPIPPGQPMTAVFVLEHSDGTVVSSWTLVAASCDSKTLLYNGPTSADADGDYLTAPADSCPSLAGTATNGCPVRERTITLRAKHGPKRVVGKLYAAGYPALHAGQAVEIWKKRPGPDRKVATHTTNELGKFKARVGSGRFYATAPALIVPAAGEVAADTSAVRRVR